MSAIEGKSCSICQNSREGGAEELEFVALCCGHLFHEACIKLWAEWREVKEQATCPECRGTFETIGKVSVSSLPQNARPAEELQGLDHQAIGEALGLPAGADNLQLLLIAFRVRILMELQGRRTPLEDLPQAHARKRSF